MGPKQELIVYIHSIVLEKPSVLIMTREQLEDAVAADPALRLSHKEIPRGHRQIEIFGLDLIPEAEREKCADYPNMGSSIAAVTLPNRVWLQRQMANQFTELYILSVSDLPPSQSMRGCDGSDAGRGVRKPETGTESLRCDAPTPKKTRAWKARGPQSSPGFL
ncbi:uncharacterized protein BKCO1_1900060 [Diplodia corticola]|uniref:Uncharacterized protein n=1 Tax=Diplodia corticola TaxID=236234 RepID=A0A1J9RR00_9PEZI|nr:uncharacterized protein BKCO1_1900060 [Diplodia corticola]OJD34955.1 hypothetical protein BKCO1_1900060 [Diplodia corticola]